MKKIAVFITGPKRYTSLVIDNLSRVLNGIDYENFIFIWDDDLSNMKRSTEFYDQQEIQNDPKTKVLLCHKPYTREYIDKEYGKDVLGHSSKNAMIGMFYSINALCSILKVSPDEKDFSHVLRIRTDCLIYDNNWLNDYEDDDVLVADNPLNPTLWISDHFMLAPKNVFLNVWGFNSSESINSRFMLAANNPEILVSQRAVRYKKKKSMRRFVDYQIIYTDRRDNDIDFAEELVKNIESYFKLELSPDYITRFEFYDKLTSIRKLNERNIIKFLFSHPYLESIKHFIRRLA
ncbi:hypothetical protein ACPSLZ_14880 [Vibrio campbellii]|uniref:hypothetical protein n=1 Tax=Vibrio campbellii TaxID=680 RepID=UPI003CE44DFD